MDRNIFWNKSRSIMCLAVVLLAWAGIVSTVDPKSATAAQVSTMANLDSVAVVASASTTAFAGDVQRYDAIRFLIVDSGAGTMAIAADWQTSSGASIQGSAETITLASDYLEVPVRAPRVVITITETSTTNPLDVTGSILGVNQ